MGGGCCLKKNPAKRNMEWPRSFKSKTHSSQKKKHLRPPNCCQRAAGPYRLASFPDWDTKLLKFIPIGRGRMQASFGDLRVVVSHPDVSKTPSKNELQILIVDQFFAYFSKFSGIGSGTGQNKFSDLARKIKNLTPHFFRLCMKFSGAGDVGPRPLVQRPPGLSRHRHPPLPAPTPPRGPFGSRRSRSHAVHLAVARQAAVVLVPGEALRHTVPFLALQQRGRGAPRANKTSADRVRRQRSVGGFFGTRRERGWHRPTPWGGQPRGSLWGSKQLEGR